jgi:transcription initiation factor TFIIB
MDRPGWLICSNDNCRAEKGFREDIKTGDIVCTLCGRVVLEKVMDMGSEWRNFDDSGESKSRAEGVDDITDKLTTKIQTSKQAERNNTALSKLHQQISGNEQKALSQASMKIQEFGAQMNLPNTVLKSAKKIYKDFETKKKRKIRGSNSDPFIVAVLYIACKENGLSRTFKELARETDIKEIEVRRMYQALTKHVKDCGRHTPVAPSDLVIRICSHLNLKSNSATYLAQQIAKNVASRLEGKSPSSIAAASVLMAVKQEGITECTEREIAQAASISPSTVKNTYKDMEGMKDDIMPKDQTA